MKNYKSNVLFAVLIGYMFVFIPVGIWSDRNLDFWISHFKEEQFNLPWWWSFGASLVGGPLTIPLNVIGEIARMIL